MYGQPHNEENVQYLIAVSPPIMLVYLSHKIILELGTLRPAQQLNKISTEAPEAPFSFLPFFRTP